MVRKMYRGSEISRTLWLRREEDSSAPLSRGLELSNENAVPEPEIHIVEIEIVEELAMLGLAPPYHRSPRPLTVRGQRSGPLLER